MDTAKERFDIVNSFLGFGDPHAPIWFVGLKEAGEWNEDPGKDAHMYRQYAKGYFHFAPGIISSEAQKYGRRFTKVYDIMSKLVVLALNDPNLSDWKYYRDHCLFSEGGRTFQTNLYPLGKPSLRSWPEKYHTLFGMDSAERYYKSAQQDRFPLLGTAHAKYRPRITICFGRTGWDSFQKIFSLGEEFGEEIVGCRIYPSNVVLTPFFSYRVMPHRIIDALGQRLRPLLAG